VALGGQLTTNRLHRATATTPHPRTHAQDASDPRHQRRRAVPSSQALPGASWVALTIAVRMWGPLVRMVRPRNRSAHASSEP